jgi:hypothetical protein
MQTIHFGLITCRPQYLRKYILVFTNWEVIYPRSTIASKFHHTPLFLHSGDTSMRSNTCSFQFGLGWLLRDGFFNKKNILIGLQDGITPLECWQAKIIRLHSHLRSWAKNMSGSWKTKGRLLDKLDELDKKAKCIMLTFDELNVKHCLHERLTTFLRGDQMVPTDKIEDLDRRWLKHKSFLLVVNGKYRRMGTFQLEQEEGVINLCKHKITTYTPLTIFFLPSCLLSPPPSSWCGAKLCTCRLLQSWRWRGQLEYNEVHHLVVGADTLLAYRVGFTPWQIRLCLSMKILENSCSDQCNLH